MSSLTYTELLRTNRNFRNLFAGQIIRNSAIGSILLPSLGLVRVVSDASPLSAGIYFVCRMLPFALVSPFAGTFVDRFSRRQVMIVTDLARVLIALSFLLVTSADDLWIVYVATVLLSTVWRFFRRREKTLLRRT
jgi:MFS family permease